MKIGIASDHAGYQLKENIKKIFYDYEFVDYGCETEEAIDYPDVAKPLCRDIDVLDIGILICGTGNGMSMTANKFSKIRAALCWTPEIAEFARLHNDANVLVLPARFIEEDIACDIIDTFLSREFEGGRHLRRVEKITD